MMRQLGSKEEAGHKVADVYRTKRAACIDKIRRRQSHERSVLAESLAVDGAKFREVVEEARNTVSSDRRLRDRGIRELQQSTAERLAIYNRATASLRALHRQLLNGTASRGEG